MTTQNRLSLPSFKSEAAIKSLGRPGGEAKQFMGWYVYGFIDVSASSTQTVHHLLTVLPLYASYCSSPHSYCVDNCALAQLCYVLFAECGNTLATRVSFLAVLSSGYSGDGVIERCLLTWQFFTLHIYSRQSLASLCE